MELNERVFQKKSFIFVCLKDRKKIKREKSIVTLKNSICMLCFLKYSGVLEKHDDNGGGIVESIL